MKSNKLILLLTVLLLSACGGKTDTPDTTMSTNIEDRTTEAAKIIKKESKDGLAIGTDIKDLMKPPVANSETGLGAPILTLAWTDLVADGYDAQSIISKYQSKLQISIEGSVEERALYKQMDEEFNRAPPNLDLAGTTVRIPGFVSPLDQNGEMVGDFLLVPYFGSCIHSPPPPVNQTVLVNPQEGGSISMSKIRRPVWVVGELKVERSSTDLAEAAYRIENARLEEYSADKKTPSK
jgi:hypothetical protein